MYKTPNGYQSWQALRMVAADLAQEEGPQRFLAFAIQNYRTPAAQLKDLLADIPDFQKGDDGYSADLTADAAKQLSDLDAAAASYAEDIADPYGAPLHVFRLCAAEIVECLAVFVEHVAVLSAPQPGRAAG